MSSYTSKAQDGPVPLSTQGAHGENDKKTATATCFCGEVQLEFPTEGPDLIDTFVCNCTDDRKITASMFASNFIVANAGVKHLRGEDKLTRYAQSKTIKTGFEMANYFCSVCGTLMYRASSGISGVKVLRIGTVDDYTLHETKLKPRVEQFTKDRVSWFTGGVGLEQHEEGFFNGTGQP
ncbi:Putative CENP-V/GFA domain, Mss4-like superfamily protein [Septoria linicola]|uniref:CENP-V/GFA domain, Mss4-like superfamily protein n=1 Tax=Septoria linicola TaxID=215465 RepID=A0A9Q9ALI2_9PEZI|nr:putative CENP-V/GFA domain, Mss4-like superfamily protein [Septoria linicola]USW49178.1 Putative CENP-V/GFA domain, Mss4-like superfamily protein [Septoria linicola]